MTTAAVVREDAPVAPRVAGAIAPVRVTDIDIAFTSMIWLFVKASFAAAIATVITSFLWIAIAVGFVMVISTLLAVLGAGLGAAGSALVPDAPAPIEQPADE